MNTETQSLSPATTIKIKVKRPSRTESEAKLAASRRLAESMLSGMIHRDVHGLDLDGYGWRWVEAEDQFEMTATMSDLGAVRGLDEARLAASKICAGAPVRAFSTNWWKVTPVKGPGSRVTITDGLGSLMVAGSGFAPLIYSVTLRLSPGMCEGRMSELRETAKEAIAEQLITLHGEGLAVSGRRQTTGTENVGQVAIHLNLCPVKPASSWLSKTMSWAESLVEEVLSYAA